MKSLRTDDIIGATPRVRHMPKNLYRQHQSYPYNHTNQYNNINSQYSPIKDYDSYYKNIGGKWDHSYNQNIYGNFPLSQYDPNPFIKQQNKSQYSLSKTKFGHKVQPYQQNSNNYQRPNSNQHVQINNRNNTPKNNNNYQNKYHDQNYQNRQKELKKKEAMFINYEQVKQFDNLSKQEKLYQQRKYSHDFNTNKLPSYLQKNNPENRQNIHMRPNSLGKSIQNINSNNMSSSIEIGNGVNRNNDSKYNTSEQSIRGSQQSLRSSESKQKNIFRGLGFNIITNSRYSYDVQTSIPYIKKQK